MYSPMQNVFKLTLLCERPLKDQIPGYIDDFRLSKISLSKYKTKNPSAQTLGTPVIV